MSCTASMAVLCPAMKQCPKCKKEYADPELNFCLDDGFRLVDGSAHGESPTAILHPDIFNADVTISMSEELVENSIAVMPFEHLSRVDDDEYFCDGLAEELINELAQVDGLKVVARTSAFSFKGKQVEVSQIGKALNVRTVLEGSVRKSGSRLRITAQLINVADGYHIWSERYDRELRDVFDLQDEITAAVVAALKAKLLTNGTGYEETAAGADQKHYQADVEAYQLYLRGRFFLNKFNAENFVRALECFEKACAIDSRFPEAYAGIADAHILLTAMGPVPPHEAMPRAKAAALKALSLDDSLSEAHCSLGLVLQDHEFQFGAAERSYQKAIELNPNNPMAHQSYGQMLAQLGRHDEAEAEFKKALEVDPLSPVGNWGYGFGLFEARRYDECLEQSYKTLELDPNFAAAYLNLAFAYHMKTEYAESVKAYATFSELCGSPQTADVIRESFAAGGWEGFLRAMASVTAPAGLTAYIIAVFRAALGDLDGAISKLDEALAKREPHVVMLKVDPRFDALRSDPRFQGITDAVGL